MISLNVNKTIKSKLYIATAFLLIHRISETVVTMW